MNAGLAMVKSLIIQFYTVNRRIKILGQNGFICEDFMPLTDQEKIIKLLEDKGDLRLGQDASFLQFDPLQLVPTKLMERPDSLSRILPKNLKQVFMAKDGCVFHITPGSLHQITQMTEKLMYIQL